MMFRSSTAKITILAAGSAFALITATAVDSAHGEGNLDASYTISFARIPVGELTATAVFGESEYAVSARARAGGVLKALLVDGDASFSTQSRHRGGCTATCWRSHSPTSSPASPGRFSRAVAPISRGSSPSDIKTGKTETD